MAFQTATPPVDGQPTAERVLGLHPKVERTLVSSAQGTITIAQPTAHDTISNPVLVQGSTHFGPFESSLSVHIKDAGGAIIGIGSVMVQAPDIDQGGSFEGEIAFTPPATAQDGILEVMEISAKDGSVVVMASVPVRLAAQEGSSSTSAIQLLPR